VRTFFGLGKWGAQEDETTTDVVNEAKQLHEEILTPLNSKFLGPLEKRSDQMMPKPMVFVLGNHSSGKSTFINYVVGKDVQTAGVAPTDDSFSVVVPGREDVDQDGPALVGDPELGFEGLRTFGGSLINHVNLKVRKDLKVDDIMLVDSPGTSRRRSVHRPLDNAIFFPHNVHCTG
jgi:ribosome biogenesis GTPase A